MQQRLYFSGRYFRRFSLSTWIPFMARRRICSLKTALPSMTRGREEEAEEEALLRTYLYKKLTLLYYTNICPGITKTFPARRGRYNYRGGGDCSLDPTPRPFLAPCLVRTIQHPQGDPPRIAGGAIAKAPQFYAAKSARQLVSGPPERDRDTN